MAVHENFDFNPNDYIKSSSDNKGKNKKKYYKSSTKIGAKIVNAETGQMLEHIVGSINESRYFTVMINEGQESVKLFYNSPEQYESHRNVSVDDNVKIEWHNKEHERRVEEFGKNIDEPSTGEDIVVK